MRLEFIPGVLPAPEIIRHSLGTLFCFGAANRAWAEVAEALAQNKFPHSIRGSFAFIWEGKEKTVAAVDHLATYPLFYDEKNISNIFHEILRLSPTREQNPRVEFEIQCLGGQSFSTAETTREGILRLLPGHRLENGKQIPYLDFFSYLGEEKLDLPRFQSLVENQVERMALDENALLLSGGTDSVTLVAIIKKIGLEKNFSFVHAYSNCQALTETHLVNRIAAEMNFPVIHSRVDFSGDVIPSQSGRQFSFWIENPFPAKRLAIEAAGVEKSRIFTGELGDQLFGGPKNNALLNYALQAERISADEVAALWINLSASYGRYAGILVYPKLAIEFAERPETKEYYEHLRAKIATIFTRMRSKDFLHRIMMMNFLIKGPYRAWAYSQDELDWVHPFAAWEIFDYAFRLRSQEKISQGGTAKSIFLRAWQSHLSDIPWSVPKHGFGIPARSKLRADISNLA